MIKSEQGWKQYTTAKGICINESCETVIEEYLLPHFKGQIQLIFTSPPFPLNRAKKYGNKTGNNYTEWICEIGEKLIPLLTPNGSMVIELGNAWNTGEPTYSTLPIETLLALKKRCKLNLCQEFVNYNPARLPSPVEWVNKKRIRVKDSFTKIWWMSSTPYPYSDNAKILEPYSRQMKKLLESGKYNSGHRPSEHNISSTAFLNDNGGAIPSNVIIAANTVSNDKYTNICKDKGIEIHPARMAPAVPDFFINFLTQEDDIVLDCFAGSNTTGAVAEKNNRQWISIELDKEYYEGSKSRFFEE